MAKLSAAAFAKFIWQRMAAKDGYIFGARGQDPKKWAKTSWWFTQYKGSQRTKALYWREHAARVWDCQGLAEGYINDVTGKNIDVRARDNFANWCDPKGKGKIPSERRVPGAAVFMGWPITHVGFLVKPVNDSDPTGDWWVVEARGVMYGVVKTRLSARSWTRWGLMTKYFDYSAPVESDADSVLATGNVNIRTQPNTQGEILGVLKKGGQLPYAGETSADGWFKVDYNGKQGWVSGKYARLVVAAKDLEEETSIPQDAAEDTPESVNGDTGSGDGGDVESGPATGETGNEEAPENAAEDTPVNTPEDGAGGEAEDAAGNMAAEAADGPELVVDMSHYNRTVYWGKLSKECALLILRASVGLNPDTKYAQYAAKAREYEIPFGSYHYLKATSEKAARDEAQYYVERVGESGPLFYVLDAEYGSIKDDKARAITSAFLKEVRRLVPGGRVGIYIAHHLYERWNCDYKAFDFVWIPRYGKNTGKYDPKYAPDYPCDLHQYTSRGKISGAAGEVDLSRETRAGVIKKLTEA